MAQPVVVVLVFATGDPDGYAAAQQPLAAGNLTLNGILVAAGVGTPDVARRAVIVSGGSDESGKTFTLYGTDRYDNVQSEALVGPGAGATVISQLDYKTVPRIAVSAATTGNVTAGTSDATTIGSSPWLPFNPHITPAQISFWVTVASTAPSTWTIEFTPDDPNLMAPPGGTASSLTVPTPSNPPWPGSGSIEPRSFSPPKAWAAHTDLTSKSADAHKFIEDVPFAWRLTINSGTTPVVAQGIQAGIRN